MAEKRSTKILPGKLLGLALDALETGDASGVAGRPWAGALKGKAGLEPPGLPKAGRIGSSNFGVVANICELVRNSILFPGVGGARPLAWLRSFYERQGPDGDLGHMLLEPLSTTYGEAHIVSALIAYALGIKEAGVFLERELALGLLHRCPNSRIVAASTRAGKNPKHWALEEFVKRASGSKGWDEPVRGTPNTLIGRAFALKGGWRVPKSFPLDIQSVLDDHVLLDSIRFASGPLIVTHHERGHVSRWETGPICYASPVPAAVACYEPWRVEYASNSAKPFTELRTRIYDTAFSIPAKGLIVVERGEVRLWQRDISDLGPVANEIRFEEVKK